jgi:HEAT repeat protein
MEPQFGIFTTDVHLVVRTWDAWLELVTSRSSAEIRGRPITASFPEIERRGLFAAFCRALESGAVELLSPALHQYLIACPTRTGSNKFRFMQQRVVIAPVREGSKITGLIVTIEDVTARREAESARPDDSLSSVNWGTRRQAVEQVLSEPSQTPVAELIRRLRHEHRDPNLLNSVLALLASGAWDALDALIDLTRDPDAEVRMYAALAMGDLKDRRAIPALLALLQDPDTNARYHAIEALAKLRVSEAAAPLADIAESGDFFLAFPALDALAAIGDSTIAPRLVPLLVDDAIRPAAIKALSQLGDHSVVGQLVALLDHERLVVPVVEALTTLHQRYENQLGEGDYIAALVARHITPAGTQHLLNALNTTAGNMLRMVIRILGWVGSGSETVLSGLTRLLGSPSIRSEVIETLVRHGKEVIGPLCGQLEADDMNTRRAAVTALGRIGDPASVPPLIGLLRDPELCVEAAGALARIGDRRAYEPLLPLLAHERAAVRLAAIAALNSLGDPRMPKEIRRLLDDADPHIRESAARIAGYFGYPECAALLFDRAGDVDENVRRAAIESLSNFEDESVVSLLLTAMCDPSPKIRAAAVQSLGRLGRAASLPDLIQALKDVDAWVRYYAVRALGSLRSPESIDPLAAALREDQAPQVRIAAAEALGSVGGRRVVSILAPFVEARDRDIARGALVALGQVGHPDAVGPILHALKSEDFAQRLDAVRAMSARRDNQAAEVLQWIAATDTNEAVVENAIEELFKMATTESIAALLRLASDRRLRERAVSAISRLGPQHLQYIKAGLSGPQLETSRAAVEVLARMKHPEASEALRSALDDERKDVRLSALLALQRLGSLISDKKVWNMAQNDSDPGVREAAQQALEQR